MLGGPLDQAEVLLAAGDVVGAQAEAERYTATLPAAWGLIARACRAGGDLAGSVEASTRWVAADPDDATAWHSLGATMLAAGQAGQAVVAFEQAAGRTPTAAMLADLGLALRRVGRPVDARGALDRAVAADPTSVVARLGRASLLTWAGDDSSALLDIDEALRLAPLDTRLLGARASALRGLGRTDEALAVLRKARIDAPEDARLAWNEALALLAAGRFESGFAAYGVRRGRARQQGARGLVGVPRWRGEPLGGRRLLVLAEQGFGDSLQFVRFTGSLHAAGAEVWVHGPARLGAMLSRVPGVSGFVARGDAPPPVDLQVGMMDVPGLLGLGEADLGRGGPYLSAPAPAASRLLGRLPADGLRVGIGWQGNPEFEADHLRSPPLARFAPLSGVAGVGFICLQQRHGRDQLPRSPLPMVDLAPELDTGGDGFVDTAAVLDCLDLVITSDTALAHLAGGMGRPTWVVLPYAADWRWLVARDDSPWYPTMRLFRQPAPGAWGPVFEAVAAALRRVIAGEEPP